MSGKKTISIPSSISEQILTVGLEHKNHRGGIGSVINTYSNYFKPFHFVATYRPQKIKLFIFPYFLASCLQLCWKLTIHRKIKIVHIHGAAKGSLVRKYIIYFLAKKIFYKKVIYHSHGSELEMFYNKSGAGIQKFVKRFFESTDQIICLSPHWESFFKKNFNVKKISILENIVENPGKVNRTPKGQNELIRLLFLGAIGDRKGIFDVLTILAEQKEKFEGKILLIIGGSGDVKRLKNFIEENKLQSLVRFDGWVNGEKKEALLRESDVYILPSYNEGLPISILEAMSYNLPVISTPVGGTPEVVKEGQNGFLISPGDKPGVSYRIEWLIHHKDALVEMGKKSGELVEPYYADEVIPKLVDIYMDLLKITNNN